MLSHIVGIILVVLGILLFAYCILDIAKLNNNEEDTNLILILGGFILISLGTATYNHAWIFSCALDELLV